jgi:NADH-quinone oxidoreductase subunit J
MSGLRSPAGIKAAAVLSVVIGIELVWALTRIGGAGFRADQAEQVSSVANIGQVLFTRYAFAFEVTSILILVSMVGAVVLARREP